MKTQAALPALRLRPASNPRSGRIARRDHTSACCPVVHDRHRHRTGERGIDGEILELRPETGTARGRRESDGRVPLLHRMRPGDRTVQLEKVTIMPGAVLYLHLDRRGPSHIRRHDEGAGCPDLAITAGTTLRPHRDLLHAEAGWRGRVLAARGRIAGVDGTGVAVVAASLGGLRRS